MDATTLCEWMEAHDWKNMELAKALDVHPVTVAKWRAGTLDMSTLAIMALGNPEMTAKRARRQRVRDRKRDPVAA